MFPAPRTDACRLFLFPAGLEVSPKLLPQIREGEQFVLCLNGEDYASLGSSRIGAFARAGGGGAGGGGGAAGGTKRDRSISGRLRVVSALVSQGHIDHTQKGLMKDLIITGDRRLVVALEAFDAGDKGVLKGQFIRWPSHVRPAVVAMAVG